MPSFYLVLPLGPRVYCSWRVYVFQQKIHIYFIQVWQVERFPVKNMICGSVVELTIFYLEMWQRFYEALGTFITAIPMVSEVLGLITVPYATLLFMSFYLSKKMGHCTNGCLYHRTILPRVIILELWSNGSLFLQQNKLNADEPVKIYAWCVMNDGISASRQKSKSTLKCRQPWNVFLYFEREEKRSWWNKLKWFVMILQHIMKSYVGSLGIKTTQLEWQGISVMM